MIPDIFLNILYGFINTILTWLGTSTGFPPSLLNALNSMGSYLDMFSPIIPIPTLIITVTLATSIEIGIFAFKTFKWIISHVPMIGGRG